jgi:hypothetical protein
MMMSLVSIRKLALSASIWTLVATSGFCDTNSDEIKQHIEQLKGQRLYLRHDVAVFHPDGFSKGENITYVLPEPSLRYSAQYLLEDVNAATFDEFAEMVDRITRRMEANYVSQSKAFPDNLRARLVVTPFSRPVTVTKVKVKKKEVQISLSALSVEDPNDQILWGEVGVVNFSFKDNPGQFDLSTVKVMLEHLLSTEPLEVGTEGQLTLGMTVDEAIEIVGEPNRRVGLGTKTVLTYDDIKLIFVNGKLSEIE